MEAEVLRLRLGSNEEDGGSVCPYIAQGTWERWLDLKNEKDTKPGKGKRGESTRASVLGPIGPSGSEEWGYSTPAMFRSAIEGTDPNSHLVLDINSPGGSVFAAAEISSIIEARAGRTTMRVLGMAASAAQMLTLAADEVLMGRAAMQMIHQSSGLVMAFGNAQAIKRASNSTISALNTIDSQLAYNISQKTGKSEQEAMSLMRAESWFSAKQAIDEGLADGFIEPEDDAETDEPEDTGDDDTAGDAEANTGVSALLAAGDFLRNLAGDNRGG